MQVEQILDLLNRIQGCTFAGLDTYTKVVLTGGRQNPMQGRITKRCTGHRIILFTNKRSNGYENMVRRRLEQAGKDPASFVLGELQWGARIPNSPLIEHNGNHYLQTILLSLGETEYFFDGVPIAKADIIGLQEDHDPNSRQGLAPEKRVIVRSYALSSIKRIRLFKEERIDAIEFSVPDEEVVSIELALVGDS